MAMSGNVFLILMIASYGSGQSLLYSSPMRSSQPFQRKSLENYYDPPLRFPRRQRFGSEVADRCLAHYNDEGGINNKYIYGVKRNPRLEYSRGRPMTKRNYGFERNTRQMKPSAPLDLFIRPQDPRRSYVDYSQPPDVAAYSLRDTYDIMQVECSDGENGPPKVACPTSDRTGRFRCIPERFLCDGFIDCPLAEDEDRQYCMFYKMTKAQMNFIADIVLKLVRFDQKLYYANFLEKRNVKTMG